MRCKRCSSGNQDEFKVEMNFHYPHGTSLNKPGVWVFTDVAVCLVCGFAEFIVPDVELRTLVSASRVQRERTA